MTDTAAPATKPVPAYAYVVPMALFGVLTWVESQFPAQYPQLYILKAILVTAALVVFRANWREVKWDSKALIPAIGVGILVLVEWIVVEKYLSYPHMGARTAYNPFKAIADPGLRMVFIGVRMLGLTLMVPLMEELFWRSFLIRIITKPEWQEMNPWNFSWMAFSAVAGLFALAHPEWLAAVICAVLYGLLLRQTKSLFACLVAHAVTNGLLGIYVLAGGNWTLW